MTYIEEYYNWIIKNPTKVPQKIKKIYARLVDELKTPKTIKILNPETEEYEEHTFIFDEEKANRPIEFIEKYCKHSKGKWGGKPIVLEVWQKALIQAAYGFIDKETGMRRYRKLLLFIARKNTRKKIVGTST